mmetsp:Transcript_6131/g.14912  ORF Transcript_6131/g.14912 Transcript_6131/m.14912 type:complete len:185 (+) Transcript_6131:892-1446(+)
MTPAEYDPELSRFHGSAARAETEDGDPSEGKRANVAAGVNNAKGERANEEPSSREFTATVDVAGRADGPSQALTREAKVPMLTESVSEAEKKARSTRREASAAATEPTIDKLALEGGRDRDQTASAAVELSAMEAQEPQGRIEKASNAAPPFELVVAPIVSTGAYATRAHTGPRRRKRPERWGS